MTITSIGYDGPIDEVGFAQMMPSVGASEYGVVGAGDWKVTAHPSTAQAVNVAVGKGWGRGVFDTSDSIVTVQCAPISSGTRWDLIAARRNWQPVNGTTTFGAISGGATADIPGRLTQPGVQDDQPIALVQWTAGQTQPSQIMDLRVWAGNGGLYAKSYLVRSYLTSVGTSVRIGDAVWSLKLGDNDVPTWVKDNPAVFSVLGGAGVPFVAAGEVYAQTNNYSVGRISFDTPFPKACRSVMLQNSTGALTAVTLRVLQKTATYVDFVAYGPNGAGLTNSGLYVNYIAVGD